MTQQPNDPPEPQQPADGQDGRDGQDAVGQDDVEQHKVVVVTPQGIGVVGGGDGEQDAADLAGMVEQPAKVMRIGSMIKQLLEEVRSAPLDEAGRARLAQVHERSLAELEQGLSTELVDELRRITLPFAEDTTPSDAELRIAQAQLVGWLEGLFHGIQTALFAQQMAARAQLEQMRRALPGPHPQPPGTPGDQDGQPGQHGTGQYL